MAPSGFAIVLIPGPKSDDWLRVAANAILPLADTKLGNLAAPLKKHSNGGVVRIFSTATTPDGLYTALKDIANHEIFSKLRLRLAIYHVRDETQEPFLDTSFETCSEAVQIYLHGMFVFIQMALQLMYKQNGGQTLLSETKGAKKGTIIVLGTPRAMKGDTGYAVWNAAHAGARMMICSVAREHATYGVHCVHAIIKGPMTIGDADAVKTGKVMSGEAMGSTYLWLSMQPATLWTHELDLRPAQTNSSLP